MGKLTGRTLISANINEDLLIHVVDTTGTPASFKATLSQLYAVFPKNSSAGASDVGYVARWTAEDELGKGVIQDDGSRVGIDTAPDAVYKLNVNGGAIISGSALVGTTNTADRKLTLVNTAAQDTTGGNYMAFYESDQTTRRGYIGFTDADTFRIYVQDIVGNSQIILDADEIILNSTDETQSSTIKSGVWEATPIADAYIASAATWNAKADVTGSPLDNQVAVFTNGTTIEGDANLTWTGSALTVTDGTDTTEVRDKFVSVKSESDDANLYLYGYGDTGSNSGEIYLAGSRGTIASPTATQSGDTLGEIGIFGAVPGLRPGARILFEATENYVDTSNYGTKFVIQTTKNGTATLATRYTIDGDGNHGFVGDIKYSQQVYQDGGIYNGGSTGTSFTPNFINGNLQKVTMSNASITINNPTNAKDGATYTMCFVQDATASRTIATWGSDWNWGDAGAPDFSGGTAAGDKFYVTVIVNGTELDAIYSGVKH